ncbi:class I SAM-dependent methyltransferase [Svornostia abyssi]|uniref:Class I SAM-dependent methyltransferase n=1 Tax=Svornostia abyssi TaxID=2898438 RepID=A0ABY5PHA2_9ACTN|nr:class I SAM-dependent methyltransferase [Parviterribacteraceae bacterium J379]
MEGRDVYSSPPPPPRRTDETRVSRRALFGLRMTGRARAEIDFEGATARVRTDAEAALAWPVLDQLGPVAEVLADLTEVARGDRVLDAGAGDGNVSRACRARGARVDACDIAAAAIARGRERCEPAVTWQQADIQALPYADDQFDVVISAFGAPLAPRPERAVDELVRVCRPGGRLAVAAWVPRGLPGGLTEFAEHVRPLPDGIPSPAAWGRDAVIRNLLGPHLEDLEVRTRTVRIAGLTPDELFTALARGTFTAEQRDELRPAFDRLLASSSNDPAGVELDARYVVVSGTVPS